MCVHVYTCIYTVYTCMCVCICVCTRMAIEHMINSRTCLKPECVPF